MRWCECVEGGGGGGGVVRVCVPSLSDCRFICLCALQKKEEKLGSER